MGDVVPQRGSGTEEVTLSMRVRSPMKDCTIVVRQGDTVLAKKKMRKALPAEMIHLKVPASAVPAQENWEVTAE